MYSRGSDDEGEDLMATSTYSRSRFGSSEMQRSPSQCGASEQVPLLQASKFDNIQKLTEDFITSLGISFPFKVHTVVATGSKLVLNEDKIPGICGLCKGIVHSHDTSTLSSLNATKLSGVVSRLGPKLFDSCSLSPRNNSHCAESCSDDVCCSSKTSSKASNYLPSLCYGCQLIRNEYGELNFWPPSMRKQVEEESRLSAMRDEIKYFLL